MADKIYKIPVTWEVYGTVEIEADSLDEAIEIALIDPSIPLPKESDYVDDSWTVGDREVAEIINKEK